MKGGEGKGEWTRDDRIKDRRRGGTEVVKGQEKEERGRARARRT